MLKESSKKKAFDEILDSIICDIQDGTLNKGQALPAERVMAESMGVSRPVVREVLKALELLGIVTSVQGGANYISENLEECLMGPLSILFKMNNGDIRQAQQLRSALEREAAFLAAENCTAVDGAELRLLIARLEETENEKLRGDLDRALHMKIGKIAGNPMIYSVLTASAQLTESIISGIRAYIMQKNHSASEVDEQHRKLVEAIAGHRKKEALQYMEEHMKTIERYIEEIAEKSMVN